MKVLKIESGNFAVASSEGVAVEFDNGVKANFELWCNQYFNDNGTCVSGNIRKICRTDRGDTRNGCEVELQKLGKFTGEKRFFDFTDVVIPDVGDRIETVDGIGVIEDGEPYSDFIHFGVRFAEVPERLKCLVTAGHCSNGLFYYTSNETDLVK